jgi:ElaB/YqjD/DUF883 family membrane-anchored ribosome-binding protein
MSGAADAAFIHTSPVRSPSMTGQLDRQRARRELRLRIARQRRRIDRRVRGLEREGRRLASWRTYVRRYPAQALAAAAGLGLIVSAGLGRGWPRLVGAQLTRRAVVRLVARLWREVEAIWAASRPAPPSAEPSGVDDGRF